MVSVRSKSRVKAKRSVPPSRVRYEEANPAVTVRISRGLRDELARLKEEHGLSLGDVLRIGLQKAKPELAAAHQRGMKKGYCDALGECLGIVEHCKHCYVLVCGLIPDES